MSIDRSNLPQQLRQAENELWVQLTDATISRTTDPDPQKAFAVKVLVSKQGGPTPQLTFGSTPAEAVNRAYERYKIDRAFEPKPLD